MNQQPNKQATKVAQNDPMLRLAELLMKINKREQVVALPTKGMDDDESSQRSSDNASQTE